MWLGLDAEHGDDHAGGRSCTAGSEDLAHGMGSYVAHYTKKKSRLRRLEQRLAFTIAKGASTEVQLALAEKVRLARIGPCARRGRHSNRKRLFHR